MTDTDIADEIKRLGLEMDYLADIADTLGFRADGGGWTVEFFDALEEYPLEKKREAALRVILMSRNALPRVNTTPIPPSRLRKSIRLLQFTFLGTRGEGDFTPRRQWLIGMHQLTWGALNTIVGLLSGIFAILFLRGRVFRWKTVTVIGIPGRRMQAVALGPVVIGIGNLPPDVLDHEMGHWYQSILLGPLYFVVIGLPSVLHALWFQRRGHAGDRHAYYRFYTEAWADAWGGAWDAHRHPVKRWWHYLRPR